MMFDLNTLFNTAAGAGGDMSGFLGGQGQLTGGLADTSGTFGSSGLQGIFNQPESSGWGGLADLINGVKSLDPKALAEAAKTAGTPNQPTTPRQGSSGLGSRLSGGQMQDISSPYTAAAKGKGGTGAAVRPGLSHLIFGR